MYRLISLILAVLITQASAREIRQELELQQWTYTPNASPISNADVFGVKIGMSLEDATRTLVAQQFTVQKTDHFAWSRSANTDGLNVEVVAKPQSINSRHLKKTVQVGGSTAIEEIYLYPATTTSNDQIFSIVRIVNFQDEAGGPDEQAVIQALLNRFGPESRIQKFDKRLLESHLAWYFSNGAPIPGSGALDYMTLASCSDDKYTEAAYAEVRSTYGKHAVRYINVALIDTRMCSLAQKQLHLQLFGEAKRILSSETAKRDAAPKYEPKF